MQFAWQEYLNAFRNVTRQYRRSLFGISAVAFGVVALILAAGFIEWIFWATREGTIQTGLGHIQVMRPGYLEGGQADPLCYLMPKQSLEMETIGRFPTVRTFAPRFAFNGLISHGDATISFIGEGVDPEAARHINRLMYIGADQNLSNNDPKGIILGRGLAENLGVKVGEAVVLLSNALCADCSVR